MKEIEIFELLMFFYILLVIVLSLFISNISKRLDKIEYAISYSDYVLQDSLLQGGIYNGN